MSGVGTRNYIKKGTSGFLFACLRDLRLLQDYATIPCGSIVMTD